jgi:hypothetical protein
LEAARQQADALSAELSDLNRGAADIRDSRGGFEVQRAEAQARLTFVRENCATELNQSLEELARELSLAEEFDLDASQARVDELRSRIEGFGAVNMMALEELSESEERLLFLTAQRQDIVDGIASTEEALREIKKRSRERFRHAFEQINKNFGEFFKELFGGGRGEMSLIEADDVLESGLDVIAQPPGKRLQNVLLLSGGEKAMAALALVLGIFHYRPSPFCLLDEVDAPLDEANVGRFTDKVVVGAKGSANVGLKWLRPPSGSAAYYRVEVATSPFFVADGRVIERDQLVAMEFNASDLRPGVYFWRVRATAATGQTSDWSDPKKFVVASKGSGSQVAVANLTAELLGGNRRRRWVIFARLHRVAVGQSA